ncbi:MAG: PKD domain-containing protein [Chitinivibrionales bacterium]
MEQAAVKNGMYACVAAALMFFACSKDTLFDAGGHTLSYPFAFVSLTLPNALSLSDTTGLATFDTVPKGRNVYFIGLVSNPQLKVNNAWIFGDGQREDTSSIAMHAFSQSGLYHAYYSIWDQEGNVLSDSVTVRVVAVPVVDSLYIPLSGDTGVGPAGIEFAWHKVPADSGDTVLSFLLLGTSRSNLDTVGKNIKGQSYSLTDTLLSSTTYYWRVVLRNNFGQIDSSVVDSFATGIQTVLSKPSIISALRDTTVKAGDALNFYAQAMDSGSTIAEYAWDFDGNGVYDFINTATDSCTHSYSLPGTYKAVLRVTDKNGMNAYDTVTITVTALQPTPGTPVIVKIKNDTTVRVGDTVKFYATVYDSSSTIAKFEWDFNGDGTFDTVKTDTSLCSHVYQAAGTYRAVLRVTDANGKTATATVKILVIPIIQTDTPVVQSISHDTTVTVLDPILLYAKVTDANDTITQYAWDFNGDGIFDTTGIHADSVIHRFPTAGLFNVVFRATDKAGLYAQDTVKITVIRQKLLQLNFSSGDTIVDFGGVVKCSISVTTPLSNLSFAIDTAHSGNYIPMKQSGASASYNFSTGAASSWDSVKMRVSSPSSDTLYAGFKVGIRPRPLTITAIDSTDSTITVTWSQTAETDFQEYLLYRNTTASVDTTGELVATITQAGTLTYTTPVPSYVPQPRYYRVYQKDKEGLLSAGSNIVFGAVRNSPPAQPVFILPSNDNDSLLSNATVRWKRSIDPNGAIR